MVKSVTQGVADAASVASPNEAKRQSPPASPRCLSGHRDVKPAITYWVLRADSGKMHAAARGAARCLCGILVHDDWSRMPAATPLVRVSCPVCLRVLVEAASASSCG